MKLTISILFNLLFLFLAFVAVERLGGVRYAWSRLWHGDNGQYTNRKSLFEKLPVVSGAVIMLGDSHMEKGEWQELFGNDSVRILNRGISGDHVNGVLDRLPEIVRHKPARIYLMVGLNDLLFGRAPETAADIYAQVVAGLRRQSPDTDLILAGLFPLNDQIRKTNLRPATIEAFNRQIAAVARRYSLSYIETWSLLGDAQGRLRADCTHDGIHLNGKGYQILTEAFKERR